MTSKKESFLFLSLALMFLWFQLNAKTIENYEAAKFLEREEEKVVFTTKGEKEFLSMVENEPKIVELQRDDNKNISKETQKGIASWYGPGFHGKKTANGETYNMYALTAAHKELRFGTVVRVTHLRSGKYINVRINDRGPFIEGRIIDLSMKAAQKIGMKNEGITKVKIEIIKTP